MAKDVLDQSTYQIIRVSKISAIVKRWGSHWALMDGGHKVKISGNAAAKLFLVVSGANESDEDFFRRNG